MADIPADVPAAILNTLPTGGTPPSSPAQTWITGIVGASLGGIVVITVSTVVTGSATSDGTSVFNQGLN